MCSNCGWDQDYEFPDCPTCNGDGVVITKLAGAGHSDDLAEYEPCPMCYGKGYVDNIQSDE